MKKYVFFDFEYNGTTRKILNLVCVSVTYTDPLQEDGTYITQDYWLHNEFANHMKLRNLIEDLIDDDYYFVAYNVVAEASSLLSLPNPPRVQEMKWIDLFLEYRNMLNHNNKLSYGKQLIDGKIRKTFPPKPKWMDSEDENNSKPSDNLAACCFKLLDVEIDTEHKNEMRDLIISSPDEFTDEERDAIMEYCRSDVKYLPMILKKVLAHYKRNYPKKLHKKIRGWMLSRGEFAARTAIMERNGYPINYKATRNFADNIVNILGEIQGEINELFPDITPFNYKLKTGTYSWNQKATREWIETLPEDIAGFWARTPSSKKFPDGQLSLSVDAFTEFFDFKHSYPKDNLGAQFVRYLKTKQNLNGFSVNTTKKTLWDFTGPDGWVRPYTNIYRSQSSRSQPSSTSFMFLKAAWMRALVQPPVGFSMCGIDYGSQEFLIAALESHDSNMVEAYDSGDVYLWFGKECKKIPMSATKKSHQDIRDRFKSSVLGIQYQMGAKSLARKIENDTGEPCSEAEAQEYIDNFDEIFWRYSDYRDEVLMKYREDRMLLLDDGWTMWGDNPNFRSVCNCPIQGKGGVIMRKAVALAQDAGLEIPFTLHDALYCLFSTDAIHSIDTLAHCMDAAFRFYYPGREKQANVRLEANMWGPDFPDEETFITTPGGMEVKQQQIYVDGRSRDEFEKFKEYFIRDEILDLL